MSDGICARIGDEVIDSEGTAWRCLNREDDSQHANGLYAALDGTCRQRYGEHMKRPLAVLARAGKP